MEIINILFKWTNTPKTTRSIYIVFRQQQNSANKDVVSAVYALVTQHIFFTNMVDKYIKLMVLMSRLHISNKSN